jgi:hypothetical protein
VDLPHGVIAHMDPILVKKIDWETSNNLEDWDITLEVGGGRGRGTQRKRGKLCTGGVWCAAGGGGAAWGMARCTLGWLQLLSSGVAPCAPAAWQGRARVLRCHGEAAAACRFDAGIHLHTHLGTRIMTWWLC